MKDILILAHYTFLEKEKGNGRFNYIAKLLSESGEAKVEIITSDFAHREKIHRKATDYTDSSYKVTMLHEIGYKKNISIRRLISHYIFSKNVEKYLTKRKHPDCIYCAVPSLSAAYRAANYAKKNNIRFIIDVQDLWPEAFKMVFDIPIISDILFYPIRRKAERIYADADDIITVSRTYMKRVAKNNHRCKTNCPVYLGTDLDYFDQCMKGIEKQKSKNIKIVYIGTLGTSYDIPSIIDAIAILSKKGIKDIELVIMGDGPLRQNFIRYAKRRKIKIKFLGQLPYEEMIKELCACHIAVNPIRKGAASIINKVADYAAAGLPVINTQDCKEYKLLLLKYQCGFNCQNGNVADIAKKIYMLYEDKELRVMLGNNGRKLAELYFDRRITYEKIKAIVLG